MEIEIRLARPADQPAITEIRTSVTENHLSVEQMAEMGITPALITEMIMTSPCCWVAVDGGEIVGFSMVDIEEASLFAVFLRASHEGRGIGRRLVRIAEDQLFQHHERIWLETGRLTRAAGFYRSLGWDDEQPVGTEDIRLEKQRPADWVRDGLR